MSTPFRPDELAGVEGLTPDELAAEARLARELESAAHLTPVTMPEGFADRVMAAVAAEPAASPARVAGHAIRTVGLIALLASIRDAFRVTFSGGFPAMVRVQALAVVLVVVAVSGGVTYGAAATLGLLGNDGNPRPTPIATDEPAESPDASGDPTFEPSIEPSQATDGPTVSPEPSESDEATGSPDPGESAEPDETTDTGGGAGSGSGGNDRTASPTRRPTPRATPTPTTRPTIRPTATPTGDPEEGTDTPSPTRTPRPTSTPTPTATFDDHGGGATPTPTPTPTSTSGSGG